MKSAEVLDPKKRQSPRSFALCSPNFICLGETETSAASGTNKLANGGQIA
tara:strand:- start:354 stop:503 length:150 start_codon:yes stop_codon:yes gene_type:complete